MRFRLNNQDYIRLQTIAFFIPMIEKSFEVINDSEVAVNFTIKATNLTNNLPVVVEEIDLDIAPSTNGDVVFSISWPITTSGGVSTDSPNYAGKIDFIELHVTIAQIN